MNTQLIDRIKKSLIQFLFIQTAVTLFSLPILIAWGLPLSIMSPISNLIFSPFLMAFLFLASLLFFTELIGIPNALFASGLEFITNWWFWILHKGSNSWLIGIPDSNSIVLVTMAGLGFIIVHHKKIQSRAVRAILLFTLLAATCLFLRNNTTLHSMHTIACNGGNITAIRSNNRTVIIDPGFLGRRTSSISWIEYTLLPFLNNEYGTDTIDHLIILQPTKLALEAIEKVVTTATVKNIYLPLWQGTAEKKFLGAYGTMRRACTQNNTNLVRIHKNVIELNRFTISITNLSEIIPYANITYPGLRASIEIDEKALHIHSAKSMYERNKIK